MVFFMNVVEDHVEAEAHVGSAEHQRQFVVPRSL